MGQWIFEELRGAAVRRQPNEAVLFKTEQTGEGEYAGNDALVREILQNAVDARATDEPVRVRLAIHDASDAPPAARLAHFFERLRPPLSARGSSNSTKTVARKLSVASWFVRISAPAAWRGMPTSFVIRSQESQI